MVGEGCRPGSADAGPPIRRIVLQSKEGDLQQQLEELVASLKAGEGARQAAQERKEKERLLAESALLLGIEEEKQARQELHAAMVRTIESTVAETRSKTRAELSPLKSAPGGAAGAGGGGGLAKEELRLLSRTMEMELKSLAEQETALTRKLDAEVERLRGLIAAEREERERQQDNILRALEATSRQMMGAIQTEKREREATEETLLALLETSVSNVQSSLVDY